MPDMTPANETPRNHIGSDLPHPDEERDAISDWRGRIRERPELWLGAAFVGGMLVAGALATKPGKRAWSAVGASAAPGGRGSVQAQAREFWRNMQGALVGVASARIQQFVDGLLPGFNEHYRRAEQRATGDPTRR